MQNSVLLFRNRNFDQTYAMLIESGAKLKVSVKDVLARGIDLGDKDVTLIDYDEIVDLLMDQSDKVFNLWDSIYIKRAISGYL